MTKNVSEAVARSLETVRELMANRGFIAFYSDGIIVIDIESIAQKNKNIRTTLEFVRYVEWVLRHELGHAIQLSRSGTTSEKRADAFAVRYAFSNANPRHPKLRAFD